MSSDDGRRRRGSGATPVATPPAGASLSLISRTRASASSAQVCASFSKSTSQSTRGSRRLAPSLARRSSTTRPASQNFGIAGVAEREHRVLQLGQLRRALGAEEFVAGRAPHPADRRRRAC